MMTLCKVKSQVLKKLGALQFFVSSSLSTIVTYQWEETLLSINHCVIPMRDSLFPSTIVVCQWYKILFHQLLWHTSDVKFFFPLTIVAYQWWEILLSVNHCYMFMGHFACGELDSSHCFREKLISLSWNLISIWHLL